MDEGSAGENEAHASVLDDSELASDIFCDVCRDDDILEAVDGFCVTCSEYLCGACVLAHKQARPSRLHKLLDKNELPPNTERSQERVQTTITTTCETHNGDIVKFYCCVHNVFGCSTCFATVHKACDRIESVLENSETLLDSTEFQTFVQNLKSIEQSVSSMVDKLRTNISEIERCCVDTVSSVREFRKQINTVLDEIEQHFITHAATIASEQTTQLEGIDRELREMSERIENISSEIAELLAAKRLCQLYIKMKDTENDLELMQTSMLNAEKVECKRFQFEHNTEICRMLNNVAAFGKLSVGDKLSPRSEKGASDKTAKHVSDIDIAPNDPNRSNYHLIGSAVICKSRMVVADHTQNAIVLLDTASNIVLDVLKEHFPFDIAVLNKDLIAVTLHSDSYVLLIRVADTLTVEKRIAIAGPGRGVAYSKDRLLITFEDDRRLQILDLDGNVVSSIQNFINGKHIFSSPRHLCVSNDGQSMYMSDKSDGRVIRLTFDGVVDAVYPGIKTPQKLCIDKHDNVFVCGGEERTVHMLSRDLILIKIILTQADSLDSDVLSISYCMDTDRLFVGMKDRHVRAYQLSYTAKLQKCDLLELNI